MQFVRDEFLEQILSNCKLRVRRTMNGGKDEMTIRNFIPAGGETRVLDLKGGDRIIRKVDFFYKSNPSTRRKGKVILYGRH